jgi:hypothetical protein
MELQQSQIELLQQQNALLQDQIDQLEQTVSTLKSDWNEADVADRLESLENSNETQQEDVDLLLSVVNDHELAIRDAENDIDAIQANMLTASDLNGYATQTWVNTQNYAAETWVENQGYAMQATVQANTQSINQNTAFISNNTGTISNFNTRLLVIENGYVQSTDLISYATQSWVLARGYGLQSDLLTNTQAISDNAGTLLDHEIRLGTAEGTLSTIEAEYVSDTVLSGLVTTTDLSNAGYLTQSDVTDLTNQVSQNTIDVLSLQGSVQTISNDYVTQNDLVGLATEDWVNSNAALGSIVSDLSDYVSVDTSTNSIIFSGANLHI